MLPENTIERDEKIEKPERSAAAFEPELDPFEKDRSPAFTDLEKARAHLGGRPSGLQSWSGGTEAFGSRVPEAKARDPREEMLRHLADFGNSYQRKAAQSIDASDDSPWRAALGLAPDGRVGKEALMNYWQDHKSNFYDYVSGKKERALPAEHYSVERAYAARHFVNNWDSPDLKPFKNDDGTLNMQRIYDFSSVNWRDSMSYFDGPEAAAQAGKINENDGFQVSLLNSLVNLSAVASRLDRLDGRKDGKIGRGALEKLVASGGEDLANLPHADNMLASARFILKNWNSEELGAYKKPNYNALSVRSIVENATMNAIFSSQEAERAGMPKR